MSYFEDTTNNIIHSYSQVAFPDKMGGILVHRMNEDEKEKKHSTKIELQCHHRNKIQILEFSSNGN